MAGEGQADYTGDLVAVFENELAEILVFGNEDSLFHDRTSYYLFDRGTEHCGCRAEHLMTRGI